MKRNIGMASKPNTGHARTRPRACTRPRAFTRTRPRTRKRRRTIATPNFQDKDS
jgi:hypothetical protein